MVVQSLALEQFRINKDLQLFATTSTMRAHIKLLIEVLQVEQIKWHERHKEWGKGSVSY